MKYLITCIALMFCSSAIADYAEMMVGEDGSLAVPVESGEAVVSTAYLGDSSLSLEETGARPVTEEELADIAAYPAMSAPIPAGFSAPEADEALINVDTRTKVDPHDSATAGDNSFPARSVVLITFQNNSGGGSRCSGWMINRNTVATAGHCIHEGYDGSYYPVGSYTIYPGYTGTSSPYGSCTANSLHTVNGWANTGTWSNWEYDYGAIKLNCSVGNSTGWMATSAPLRPRQQNTIVNGYPGDKPYEQWMGADRVRKFFPLVYPNVRKIWYANDTTGGMSGSPIWNDSGSNSAPISVGVHAYGTDSSGWNSGTFFNPARINNLNSWRAL